MKPVTAKGTRALLGLGMIAVSTAAWCRQMPVAGDQVLRVENEKIAAAASAADLKPYFTTDVVLYDMSAPAELHGWKSVRENFTARFAQVRNPKVEILTISAFAEGKLAYAYSTRRFSFDLPNHGPHREIVFRQTDILKKTRGGWRVEHQHLSLPCDPKTGNALPSPPQKPR